MLTVSGTAITIPRAAGAAPRFPPHMHPQNQSIADAFVRMLTTELVVVVTVGGFTALFLIANAWLAIRGAPSPVPRRYVPAVFVGCGLVAAMIGCAIAWPTRVSSSV